MNESIRIMICDDSSVLRRLVQDTLSAEPDFEVVYAARHGRDAVDNLEKYDPQLVLLDVEMPVMDGIETVQAIRQCRRTLPIIMFSSITARGAEATLDALAAGANDYVTKPTGTGHLAESMSRVRSELAPKIRLLTRRVDSATPRKKTYKSTSASQPASRPTGDQQPAGVVVIGVSTGGPNALAQLLPQLPANLPVPVLIVQHMPPTFTRFLADRLSASCACPVQEATGGTPLRAGRIWIAPGDHHLVVAKKGSQLVLELDAGPEENSCRPAADVLFRSVAKHFGDRTLAVVLTGMGKDGLAGSRAINAAHGHVLVQDEASSVVWGMPREVAEAGIADEVLPLDQLGDAIVQRVCRNHRRTIPRDRSEYQHDHVQFPSTR